jgi:SAM-dependent methyltransferase
VHRAVRAEVLHGTGAGNSESEAPDGKDVWSRRMTNRFQLVAAAVDWLTVNRSVGGGTTARCSPIVAQPARRGKLWPTGGEGGIAMTIEDTRAAAGTVDPIYWAGASGAMCWARNHRGHIRELPMTRWIGGPNTAHHDRLADEQVLRYCSQRPTLDLGCGPGRFTAALQQRGSAALGVDTSRAAVELTRVRGGTAIHADLFAPLPAEGRWEQVLLTDGNIGIGGDPVRTLGRAADLLAPGGIVIAEIDPPTTVVCHELLRWETEHHVGQWFPWSRVNADVLGDIAVAAGFLVTNIVDVQARVIAVLRARTDVEKR